MRRVHDYDPRRGDDILEDGDTLHVPLMLCDSTQRAVQQHFDDQRTLVHDALCRHNAGAGHRPGYCFDALAYPAKSTVTTDAVSKALRARTGKSLEQALNDRAAAFKNLERRTRTSWVDAKVPEDDPENDPEDDDDDDERDVDDLAAAQADREIALQEAATRGANAWRLSPSRATAVEQQAERWRGGR
jgi:hypothetical protein